MTKAAAERRLKELLAQSLEVHRQIEAAAPPPKQKNERAATPIDENWEAKNARIGATLDLQDIPDSERAFLATCQKIHRRERGCDSPFEEFFAHLVFLVERGQWPTPDDVADNLKTFREEFAYMRESSKNFIEAYPEQPAAPESKHVA